jgi:hypothetical protein
LGVARRIAVEIEAISGFAVLVTVELDGGGGAAALDWVPRRRGTIAVHSSLGLRSLFSNVSKKQLTCQSSLQEMHGCMQQAGTRGPMAAHRAGRTLSADEAMAFTSVLIVKYVVQQQDWAHG